MPRVSSQVLCVLLAVKIIFSLEEGEGYIVFKPIDYL